MSKHQSFIHLKLDNEREKALAHMLFCLGILLSDTATREMRLAVRKSAPDWVGKIALEMGVTIPRFREIGGMVEEAARIVEEREGGK